MTELDEKTIEEIADILVEKSYELEPDDFKQFLDKFGELDFKNHKIVQKYISDNAINKAIE